MAGWRGGEAGWVWCGARGDPPHSGANRCPRARVRAARGSKRGGRAQPEGAAPERGGNCPCGAPVERGQGYLGARVACGGRGESMRRRAAAGCARLLVAVRGRAAASSPEAAAGSCGRARDARSAQAARGEADGGEAGGSRDGGRTGASGETAERRRSEERAAALSGLVWFAVWPVGTPVDRAVEGKRERGLCTLKRAPVASQRRVRYPTPKVRRHVRRIQLYICRLYCARKTVLGVVGKGD